MANFCKAAMARTLANTAAFLTFKEEHGRPPEEHENFVLRNDAWFPLDCYEEVRQLACWPESGQVKQATITKQLKTMCLG